MELLINLNSPLFWRMCQQEKNLFLFSQLKEFMESFSLTEQHVSNSRLMYTEHVQSSKSLC